MLADDSKSFKRNTLHRLSSYTHIQGIFEQMDRKGYVGELARLLQEIRRDAGEGRAHSGCPASLLKENIKVILQNLIEEVWSQNQCALSHKPVEVRAKASNGQSSCNGKSSTSEKTGYESKFIVKQEAQGKEKKPHKGKNPILEIFELADNPIKEEEELDYGSRYKSPHSVDRLSEVLAKTLSNEVKRYSQASLSQDSLSSSSSVAENLEENPRVSVKREKKESRRKNQYVNLHYNSMPDVYCKPVDPCKIAREFTPRQKSTFYRTMVQSDMTSSIPGDSFSRGPRDKSVESDFPGPCDYSPSTQRKTIGGCIPQQDHSRFFSSLSEKPTHSCSKKS